MSRIFNELKKNYSQIPNELINNEDISKEARFLFILLAAQAAGFKPKQKWILRMMNWKDRGTLSKYWKEIEDSGWGYRLRQRTKGGHLSVYDYYLFAAANVERVQEALSASAGFAHSGCNPQWMQPTEDAAHTHNKTKEKNNTKGKEQDQAAEAVKASPEVLGKALLYDSDHMEQPTSGKVAWYMTETGNSEYDLAHEIMTLAIEFKKQIGAVPGNTTIAHWALWEAKEFHRYWTEKNWGRGKTKRTQEKNQIKSVVATIRNRVNDQLTRGKYTRPAPGSPEYGRKPWEMAANQEKPKVAPRVSQVQEEIEY